MPDAQFPSPVKIITVLLCLAGAASAFAANIPLYVTASAGRQAGGYEAALSATPFQIYSRQRDTFTPSIGLGWKFNSRLAVEVSYTDFGEYEFDQEYGLSPFIRPGSIAFQVTSRLLIRENLAGISLRVPLRFALNPRVRLEVAPGANHLELSEHFSNRSLLGTIGSPTMTLVDSPYFSRSSVSWRPEGKASLAFAFNERLSATLGYLYTDVARKKLSVVSAGGRFDF